MGIEQNQNNNSLLTLAQNITKEDIASVSSAGVNLTLRSAKEVAEGQVASKSLSYNPLKYWQACDRNARQ